MDSEAKTSVGMLSFRSQINFFVYFLSESTSNMLFIFCSSAKLFLPEIIDESHCCNQSFKMFQVVSSMPI